MTNLSPNLVNYMGTYLVTNLVITKLCDKYDVEYGDKFVDTFFIKYCDEFRLEALATM